MNDKELLDELLEMLTIASYGAWENETATEEFTNLVNFINIYRQDENGESIATKL